jgi:hypothetical protein
MPSNTETKRTDALGFIVLAAYRPNQSSFTKQLRSIADQSMTGWRCLITADGEWTQVDRLVRLAVGSDDRFEVIGFQEREGFYRNFERGLAAVPLDAAWVALADQDDEWYPHKLERLVPELSDAVLVSGQAHIDVNGDVVGATHRRDVSLTGLLIDNQVTGSFCVFRPGLLRVALPFPAPVPGSFHDHWIAICAKSIGTLIFVEEPVQKYIQHGGNVIGERQGEGTAIRLRRLFDGRHGNPWVLTLTDHRLGWRRKMAATVLERAPVGGEDQQTLRLWSGSRRMALLMRIIKSVVAGQAPPLRACGLIAAMLLEAPRKIAYRKETED